MQRIWSVDLAAHVGEHVVVAGWLHRLRRLSSVSFLIVRDARGLAQVVLDEACRRQIEQLHAESVLRVHGLVVATPQAPRGVELVASAIDVLSEAVEPPPFELHRPRISAQLPTLLDHAAVSLRHPRKQAVFRVEAAPLCSRSTISADAPTWPRARNCTSRRWSASSSASSKSARCSAPSRTTRPGT